MADVVGGMKRLPEDVVEYTIYPNIPSHIEGDGVKKYLEKQIDAILAHLSRKLLRYIWQHEPFRLRPVVTEDSTPSHLHGSTSFGDNIDDEWFIVSLLYEITREFSGTVVRVNDNDEEFLLIEAAEVLPKWLDPETAENRVYIYNGDLHVIPIPQATEDFEKYPLFTPTPAEAVTCVRDCTCDTRSSQAVQNCINKKLAGLPKKVSESVHRVNCYLPTPLAVLLSEHPGFVAAGVRSFYYRDPLELKACRPMKRFKPDDLVRTRVTMTRCLYAQLVQQQFTPDKLSGWSVVGPANPQFQERDIGVKLAHGFEILCSKCRDEDSRTVNGELVLDSHIRWQQFRRSLQSQGYFRGEIEGSRLYQELLRDAKHFFASQIEDDESFDSENMGQQVLRHIKQLQPKFDEFRRTERTLPASDDDEWMHVTPDQVDELMRSSGGLTGPGTGDTFDLSKVAESMSSFVDHESGIDGAEFPSRSAASAETDDGDGQFEGGGLIHAMQKMFDFPDDKDSSGSDMSEYDWSEESEEDLGSPTKMPSASKTSNVARPRPETNGKWTASSKRQTKTVRFQTSEASSSATTSHTNGKSSPSSLPEPPPLPPRPPSMAAQRPSNLRATSPPSRPSEPPPPRPSSQARTSAGSRPPRRPLAKPNAVVKPRAPPPPPPPKPGEKRDKKLDALMDAMDRELAATEVGKSFERTPKQNKPKRPSKPAAPPGGRASAKTSSRDINDEDDDFRPVNVDLNVVKNTLESFKAQQGLPGPASNILSGLGVRLPRDAAET
ncbi:protein ecdysoneless homolog [Aplysia californica]|uniref:Protein ecdysoneless homolog n=1 Tax=Aplysia californica TaxID=6500 RepID=A0ABM0K940_APLCA|nr:protein ecdysoneless homolog [Aplysia californica]